MRTIYKYNIAQPIIGHIEKFLHTDYQGDEIMVWAIVNDKLPKREFAIICSGTGWPIADFQNDLSYIGTVQSYEGYVWHYFAIEVEKIKEAREAIQASLESAFATPETLETEEEEYYFEDDDDEELPEDDLARLICQVFIGAHDNAQAMLH